MTATVGETRAFLASAYGVPHTETTHYVIVADSPDCGRIITCCDGTDEAGELLAAALRSISGKPALAPESGSVIVSRKDLLAVLADAWALASNPAAFNRLAQAAGLVKQ